MIPEEGTVLETNGPGVHPILDTITEPSGLSNMILFHNPIYNALMDYVQLHVQEEQSFISMGELPDRCEPGEGGLYIEIYDLSVATRTANAEIMLVWQVEEDEPYTYFYMSLEYYQDLKITTISTLDCSA